jgi:hypothetical protein
MQVLGHRLGEVRAAGAVSSSRNRAKAALRIMADFSPGMTALRHHLEWHGRDEAGKKKPDRVAQALQGIFARCRAGYAIAESSLRRVKPASPRMPEPRSIKEPGSGTDVPVVSRAALLGVAIVPSLPLTKSRM